MLRGGWPAEAEGVVGAVGVVVAASAIARAGALESEGAASSSRGSRSLRPEELMPATGARGFFRTMTGV